MRGNEGKAVWTRVAVAIVLVAIILAAAWFGFRPALVGGLHEEHELACQENLRKIGMALQVYASEHYGEFPEGRRMEDVFARLAPLTDDKGERLVTEETFLCPAAAADRGEWKRAGEITDESSSYVWTPELTATAPADIMVFYEKSPNHHGGGRNVLYVDGRVEWVTEKEFGKKLAEQEEKVRAFLADPDAWRK